MIFPEAYFTIIEDNKCPLYELGDEFKLSDNAFFLPNFKPACLVLVLDITEVLFNIENVREEDKGSEPSNKFLCSGCTGSVQVEFKTKRAVPQKESKTRDDSDMGTVAALLRNFSFFQAIEKEHMKELVSLLRIKRYQAGDTVIKKGTPGKSLYIVLSGKVEVIGEDGISIAHLGKEEVFGEMSLLSGDPVAATVMVKEPTKILYLKSKDFRKVLHKFPSLQMYFTRLLAQRLAKTNIDRSKEFASGMLGRLSEMPPSELFQALNVNQKTGVLTLTLPEKNARVYFRDGELIFAIYGEMEGEEAFYELLKQTIGRFKFDPHLPPENADAEQMGEFMWLLMEGVRRMDEEGDEE